MKELVKYYSQFEVKSVLDRMPEYRDFLYSRGFVITNDDSFHLQNYPFYGQWEKQKLSEDILAYVRNNVTLSTYTKNEVVLFLIGHAINPFEMLYQEQDILVDLAEALFISEDAFWKKTGELTGVYTLGFIRNGVLTYAADCAGMRISFYGVVGGKFYITSHCKLIGDLRGLSRDPYVVKLVNTKAYRPYGRWLPADMAAYKEFKRLLPDNKIVIKEGQPAFGVFRFYPTEKIEECRTEAEEDAVFNKLSEIMHRNMELYAEKWPDKRVAISVTGGRDSTTTLACTNGLYDKYHYFSYISNKPESVDAEAAHEICTALGLHHDIYEIPSDDATLEGVEIMQMIIACNHCSIGKNNPNDVRKRLWFARNHPFDIEVKSWVNEAGRGSQYHKFNLTEFPAKPTPGLLRTMHKVYLDPVIIHQTNVIFRAFIDKFFPDSVVEKYNWSDLFWKECSWAGYFGGSMTSEHMLSYDITVPFNNRNYVELMMKIPLQKRLKDYTPDHLVALNDKRIAETGVQVKDIEHTDRRADTLRLYLRILSHLNY